MFFLIIRRPSRSTLSSSSAASDVYKRQVRHIEPLMTNPNIQKLMFDCRRDVEALSAQMKLKPAAVLDLQLYFTSIQWKTKSVNRRSGMTFVIKNVCGLTPQEGDSAVQAAMTLGNRPVWDIRPLPSHFLDYAADDVRHTPVSYTHLRAHETPEHLVCRLLLEKKKIHKSQRQRDGTRNCMPPFA
eukprot:TRINITY_DN25964_c0_g1_i1.p1 TRINITY_DN25964_c0_g1~~TRINITY_DN25964_c0_g1_i1.p1  ORF type:complete len:185 (-),score=37.89 TRINITY_DN25964_c0_g1_i1:82-636(-)